MDTTTSTNTSTGTATITPPDAKVLVGLTHGAADAEDVLIAYLMSVEALRAGKEAVMWLTKDAVEIAVEGAIDDIVVEGAPSLTALHDEFVASGGRMLACPVCVKLRDLVDAPWAEGVTVAGAPAVYEYTSSGALVFNY